MSRREFSKQTRRDAWKRCDRKCEGIKPSGERCGANLTTAKFHFDHIIPDAIGGPNDLTNCQVLCVACHKTKTTKIDAPIIAKATRVSDRYLGIKKPRSMTKWRKFNGTPVHAPRER